MATEVHQFQATIPAGTAKATPVTRALAQANYEIESIDLEVPPGPSGLMGFYIALSGQQWIPWEPGAYIVWNDRTENFPTENQVVNGGWQVVGYNTGAYDHTVTVRFHTNPIPSPEQPEVAPYIPQVNIISTPLELEPVVL